MPVSVGGITIKPPGAGSVATTITFGGHTAVMWLDAACTSPATFPTTVAASTTFYADTEGTYTVSCTFNGIEVASSTGTTVPIDVRAGDVSTVAVVLDRSELPTVIGSSLVVAGPSNGTDDTASLQLLLTAARVAGGGTVRGTPGQTYKLSAALVVGTGVTLDMSGCKVVLNAGSNSNLAVNYANVNPVATATDAAVTSGSNVVTTALASQAVVGQTLVVSGAGAAGNGELIGRVSAVGGGTITLVKQDDQAANATATVAAATVSLYTRDSNFTIKGGYWDRGANTPDGGLAARGSAVAGHSIFISHADGFTVDIDYAVSTHGISFVWITDARKFVAAIRDCNVVRTAMQIVGPIQGGTVSVVKGTSTDDLVSVCGNVYREQTNTAGDVYDLRIEHIQALGVGGSALRLNSGAGCLIDRVTVGHISGTAVHGVNLGEETSRAETTGGTYGSIDLGFMAITPTTASWALYMVSPSASSIRSKGRCNTQNPVAARGTNAATIDRLYLDYDFTGDCAQAITVEGLVTINEMVVTGTSQNSTATANLVVLNHTSPALVRSLIIKDMSVRPTGASADLLRFQGAGQCTSCVIENCSISFSGTTLPNVVYVNASSAILGQLIISNCDVTFAGTSSGRLFQIDAGTANRVKIRNTSQTSGASVAHVSSGTTVLSVHMDGLTTTSTDRIMQFRANTTLFLGQVARVSGGNPAFFVSGATATIYGGMLTHSGGNTVLVQRAASETVNILAPTLQSDLAQLAKSNGAMCHNTNSGLTPVSGTAAGLVGPCVCDGTVWHNVASGSTF